MMERLHISWTELQAQPQEELEILQAFMGGEADANTVKAAAAGSDVPPPGA